jgi:chromosome segregation ATPase
MNSLTNQLLSIKTNHNETRNINTSFFNEITDIKKELESIKQYKQQDIQDIHYVQQIQQIITDKQQDIHKIINDKNMEHNNKMKVLEDQITDILKKIDDADDIVDLVKYTQTLESALITAKKHLEELTIQNEKLNERLITVEKDVKELKQTIISLTAEFQTSQSAIFEPEIKSNEPLHVDIPIPLISSTASSPMNINSSPKHKLGDRRASIKSIMDVNTRILKKK